MFKNAATRIAHNSTIPALAGNKDLKPLQDLIHAEKAIVNGLDRLSVDFAKASEALKNWGVGEGDDLGDVLTASSTLLLLFSSSLSKFSTHLQSVRDHMKSVRTREESLDELKRRRKSLGAKADQAEKKLNKMSPENKNVQAQMELLNKLREEIRELDADIMHDEAGVGDHKRAAVKDWMGIKFGALQECGEKAAIVGEFGKLVIQEIPLDPTQPGLPRAYYSGTSKTRILITETERCANEVLFTTAPQASSPDPSLPPGNGGVMVGGVPERPGRVRVPSASAGGGSFVSPNPTGSYVSSPNLTGDAAYRPTLHEVLDRPASQYSTTPARRLSSSYSMPQPQPQPFSLQPIDTGSDLGLNVSDMMLASPARTHSSAGLMEVDELGVMSISTRSGPGGGMGMGTTGPPPPYVSTSGPGQGGGVVVSEKERYVANRTSGEGEREREREREREEGESQRRGSVGGGHFATFPVRGARPMPGSGGYQPQPQSPTAGGSPTSPHLRHAPSVDAPGLGTESQPFTVDFDSPRSPTTQHNRGLSGSGFSYGSGVQGPPPGAAMPRAPGVGGAWGQEEQVEREEEEGTEEGLAYMREGERDGSKDSLQQERIPTPPTSASASASNESQPQPPPQPQDHEHTLNAAAAREIGREMDTLMFSPPPPPTVAPPRRSQSPSSSFEIPPPREEVQAPLRQPSPLEPPAPPFATRARSPSRPGSPGAFMRERDRVSEDSSSRPVSPLSPRSPPIVPTPPSISLPGRSGSPSSTTTSYPRSSNASSTSLNKGGFGAGMGLPSSPGGRKITAGAFKRGQFRSPSASSLGAGAGVADTSPLTFAKRGLPPSRQSSQTPTSASATQEGREGSTSTTGTKAAEELDDQFDYISAYVDHAGEGGAGGGGGYGEGKFATNLEGGLR